MPSRTSVSDTERRLEKADRVIAEVLGISLSEQQGPIGIHDIPSWDSLKHVELMLALDSALDFGVSAETAAKLITVDAIREYARVGAFDSKTEAPQSQPVARGLRGVMFDETQLSEVTKNGAELRYRGYSVEDLAQEDFTDTAHLLLFGELPSAAERIDFARLISDCGVPTSLQSQVLQASAEQGAMAALSAAMAVGDERNDPVISLFGEVIYLTASLGRTRWSPERIGEAPMAVGRFLLRRLTGVEPGETETRALNAALVLSAEHGANASSFSVRVARSAGASLRVSVVSGVATFSGNRHGGAVTDVVRMLETIGDPKHARAQVRSLLDAKSPTPGFGHGVYRTTDPRAPILRRLARDLALHRGGSRWLDIMDAVVEELSPQAEYGVCPNVDAYLGVLFATLELPRGVEGVVFSSGRVAGWLAHAAEQSQSNVLIRPQLRYVGPAPRQVPSVARRGCARTHEEQA